MKRLSVFLLCLAFIIVVTACSSGDKKSDITLASIIKAYTDQGVEVDPNKKQMYQMVGAKDGVIFYLDNSPVKIYEFDSVKELKKAKSDDDTIIEWPSNSRFLLETNSEKAKDIFNLVK